MNDQNLKLFILDTNVLVYDPTALYRFEHVIVGIPAIVLEELDSFKTETTSRGKNSREAIRNLDKLRTQGSLRDGVQLDNGAIVRVLFVEREQMPSLPFRGDSEDNEILLTALVSKNQGIEVKFISKDINARVKADVLGIAAEDYLLEHVSEQDVYKGWVKIQVPAVQLKKENPEELGQLLEQQRLMPHEFVLAESNNNPFNYRLYRYLGGDKFKPVYEPRLRWPLKPRNPQQLMALDLLLDDSIQMVSLLGPAGTGKTFLALLAGLHKVLAEDIYQKILISRPVVPLGRDIGFLPGDIQEKLRSWMLPIYDNMEFIMHAASVGQQVQALAQEPSGHRDERFDDRQSGKKHKKGQKDKFMPEKPKRQSNLAPLEELARRGKISLEAITYMRGRSIPYQYILIDEVQNLTPHEVKTLVSRVGAGSKIILTGDPYQIDSPYLDFSSNGLVIVGQRFRGQKIFGTVFLESSERSELSKLANELL